MSQSRIQIKVGIFLLIGLVLLGALTILFSRSAPFYKDYYELRLISGNVGGIKAGAKVLMRGVPVGYVKSTELNPGGQDVTIILKIEAERELYSDARFELEQAGFLGDQFVSIYPALNSQGYQLTNQATVIAKPPFNMQEAVAVATEMIVKISQTTTNLNAAVSDVRRLVLTEQKLASLGTALEQLTIMTAKAETTMENLNHLVSSNSLPITQAISNLNEFSAQLPVLADYVNTLVQSNGVHVSTAIQNLETTSVALTNLVSDLQNGRGVAGRLLYDETMAANLSLVAHNLAVTTSNLNIRGLWGILWKQKPSKKDSSP